MRGRRGNSTRRQGRIESKRPITVIRAVTATLMTITTTSKTTTKVKAYDLPSSASRLPPTSILPKGVAASVTFNALTRAFQRYD
jgi:hypothetical protein